MECHIKKLVGWEEVLDGARTTVGKDPLNKEPSDKFKRKLVLNEHSPLRKLLFSVTFVDMPYWVAMHFRTHHIGFKSGEDDLYFVETQRSDRTQVERDNLPQDAPVTLSIQINAQSIINVSRVRLCRLTARETREAWLSFIGELIKIEPFFAGVCVPNCVYKGGLCPETDNCCGYIRTNAGQVELIQYKGLF